MDLMELRRGLMMAQGTNYIKGTFVVPTGSGWQNVSIDFGRTITSYIYYIWMDDESKPLLINSGQDSLRCYGGLGVFRPPTVNNVTLSDTNMFAYKYNPTSNTISLTTAAGFLTSISETGIIVSGREFNTGNAVYKGCKYNYIIVEIK